jgi:hypothetical protein
MALAAPDQINACIPKSDPPKAYVLAFSKGQYYVPAHAVLSFPKRANTVPDGTKLGEILFTKAPQAWSPYCHPDTLMHVKGNDGSTCVYTTFAVEGHENERRFLRFISGSIAAKNFPEWKKTIEEEMARTPPTYPPPTNDRQRTRLAVLDWEKEKNCPNKAQLNPEINGWTPLGKDGAEEHLKSCRVDPETKKRVKGSSQKCKRERDDDDADEMIKFSKVIKNVGPKGTYSINEQNGFIHFVQYDYPERCGDDAKDGVAGEDDI